MLAWQLLYIMANSTNKIFKIKKIKIKEVIKMTRKVNEVYKHCFAHICAAGVLTLMTLPEVIKTYTNIMCRDLQNCGVDAEEHDVKAYITEQYGLLKDMQNKDVNIVRM